MGNLRLHDEGKKFGRLLIFALPLVFFVLFYFYPLADILRLGLFPEGRIAFDALGRLLTDAGFLRVFWFTVWQAAVSTLLTLLFALPGAYVLARYRFRGKDLLRVVVTLPFVLPTVVVASAFVALLGPQGVVNSWLMRLFDLAQPPVQLINTLWIILLAHVFYNYSVALRIISTYWQNLGPSLTEAAQMLGASPRRAFWHVTLPLLRPAMMAAAVLVFIFSFTSFGVILILGGPRFATLEVEIYRQAVNLFNLPVAAALSLWQIAFTFVLMWFYTRSQARLSRPAELRARQNIERPLQTRRDRLLVGGNVLFMLLLLGTPLLALLVRSFSGREGWSARFYRELFVNRQDSIFFVPPVEAIANSLAFATAAMALAVSLGLISAHLLERERGRFAGWLDPIFMLPLATSAVTLGLGYLIALDRPPLDLRSSMVLVPIAHTLVAMPFVLRSVLPALRRINPNLREVAAVLGAGEWRVWQEVEWPLVRGALLVGAVFAFTISMGEFGATVFIARPQTPTMPVAIYRFLGQPGALNYGQALAMSSLLMLVCAAGFLLIERFRVGDEGEF
jgi:thiamine transport system permease protein